MENDTKHKALFTVKLEGWKLSWPHIFKGGHCYELDSLPQLDLNVFPEKWLVLPIGHRTCMFTSLGVFLAYF